MPSDARLSPRIPTKYMGHLWMLQCGSAFAVRDVPSDVKLGRSQDDGHRPSGLYGQAEESLATECFYEDHAVEGWRNKEGPSR